VARGERVNIGVVVATPGGLDVRLPELRKLQALTGHHWVSVVNTYEQQIRTAWGECGDLARLWETPTGFSQVFSLGRVGTLVASVDDYEKRVRSILTMLVDKPTLTRREKTEKINSEIAKMLKGAGLLAGRGQTIDDNRVVSRFVVDEEKKIIADFAYRTTQMTKIVSTLDLRSVSSAHLKACEKGATLYFAKNRFGRQYTAPFGIYAASPIEAEEHKGEIDILSDFADGKIFNWQVAQERQHFRHEFY